MENCTETADGVTVEFADGHEPVRRPLRRRLRRRPQRHPPADGGVVRRHHVLDALAGRRLRQRSARPSQQRGRRGSRAAVRLDLDRARNPALRVHDSRRRVRRRGRGSGVRQAHARAAGPAPGPRRHHPAPGLHPPLAHRGRVPQGPADAGRRRRAPDAGVAGAGLQQRHPRRGQPRLEARRGGQRPRRRRAARHLRRRTAQARPGDDRPVHHGRPGHLADEPAGGGAAGPGDSRRVGGARRSSATSSRCGSSRCRATSRAPSSTPSRASETSPTGTLFIQPRVDTRDAAERAARRRARHRLRRAVLEQQPARTARRRGVRRGGRRWGPSSLRSGR